MPTYRMHLENGVSIEKFQKIVDRLGHHIYRGLEPVRGGGRNLVVAVDISTRDKDTAEWVGKKFWKWGEPNKVRVSHVEEVA